MRFLHSGVFASILLVTPLGCEQRQVSQEDRPPIEETQADSIMLVGLDMSGSFYGNVDKSFICIMKAIDQFFRSGIGSRSDRVILFQLSGQPKPMLWDGSPNQMKRFFGSSRAFRDFVTSKSNPGGSRIYDGVSDSLTYLLSMRGVREKQTRVTLLIFSDMIDNLSDPQSAKPKLLRLLDEFSRTKNSIGMYFVEQCEVAPWRDHLRDCGLTHFVVEPDFRAEPTLPSWPD